MLSLIFFFIPCFTASASHFEFSSAMAREWTAFHIHTDNCSPHDYASVSFLFFWFGEIWVYETSLSANTVLGFDFFFLHLAILLHFFYTAVKLDFWVVIAMTVTIDFVTGTMSSDYEDGSILADEGNTCPFLIMIGMILTGRQQNSPR